MTNMQRKALGRGFGALLKAVDEKNSDGDSAGGVAQLEIDRIGLNPRQPRQEVDPVRLEELAQSIRVKGVIQPILVRPTSDNGNTYELVAGERRLKASKLAGFDRIPAVIRPIRDTDLLEIALIENIQRDDLNAIEEAKAYRQLLEEHGYTQEDLSKRIGRSRPTIANLIRLLQLPEEMQADLAAGRLTAGHARALLSVSDEKKRASIRDRIVDEEISVREVEALVKDEGEPKVARKKTRAVTPIESQLELTQDRLREYFATKVSIRPNGDKGKIELEYYSKEDFNRICALLLK